MPFCPTLLNLNGLPTKNLNPVSCPSASFDSVLCSSVSFGFGSKVSMCPGPPSMKSMMTFFAFAGNIGALRRERIAHRRGRTRRALRREQLGEGERAERGAEAVEHLAAGDRVGNRAGADRMVHGKRL